MNKEEQEVLMTESQRRLYATNAAFRQAVDMILPVVLEGLEARAEEMEEARQHAVERAMETSTMGFWVPPELKGD